jgi:two-component system CheB/CheR fusion protein
MKDELGSPCRMIGSMLDITQLKQAEQAIANSQAERKFLAESMPLIVWMTDEMGNITFVNRQFEKYTGLSTDEILAKGWRTVIHPQDINVFLETWRQSLNRAEEFTLELRLLVQGGEYHWNLLRANPRKNRVGAIVNWVITSVDIHEQKSLNKLLEEKVASRTRELEEVNEALRLSNNDLKQFASVASHDLQEPIRKMVMFSRMVTSQFRDQLPEKAHFYLDAIASSSERMRAMITNILNFSKISPDRGDFRLTDINAMLKDIQDDYELLIKEKKAVITIGRFPDMEVIPNLIRQVFQNLISNALKFARDGVPPHITITATRLSEKSFTAPADPDGPFCLCTVHDNGIGFNEEFREKIFVLFHRINPKDKYEGSGIGLAIVKKVIDIHQGFVRGSGAEGQGALFELVIPIKQ